jgi:quercetin dioxygenase-like cupin family protein
MATPPTAKLVEPGQGRTVKLYGVRFDYKVESADAGGDLAVLQVEIPPRTLVKPHNHTREDEYSLVLEGTVGVRVGDDVGEAGAGASLVKPRGVAHAMWNATGEPARILEILSPGGLERYFEELAPVLRDKAPPSDYYALAERYGLVLQDDWIEELERTYGVKL